MINTFNETSLHRTLKTLYSIQNEGSVTEEKVGQYICDIVTKEGSVIEIQTGSLGHLLAKIMFLISQKKKVTVVYPLPVTKYIETDKKRRKSPAKKNVYSMFRELTALCPVLLNRYFTLEVLEITYTEERASTPEPVQSANKKRRFRKNWIKTGKHLDSIDGKYIFHGKKSYLTLLPKHIPEFFTVNDLCELFKNENSKVSRDSVQLLIWVYTHAGLFEYAGKDGRANRYTIPAKLKNNTKLQ